MNGLGLVGNAWVATGASVGLRVTPASHLLWQRVMQPFAPCKLLVHCSRQVGKHDGKGIVGWYTSNEGNGVGDRVGDRVGT